MRVICTADLHLGRISSRLINDVRAADFTARAAWERVVELALNEKADAVAVAGDVIDASGNYFEACGPLETGLKRLSSAGIETLFVAGNHDWNSLPRFCEQFAGLRLRLLGRGGRWERQTIERGDERLHICGWSFPAARHTENPLLAYRHESDGVPVLGLLHADVNQMGSPYGPCSSAELLAAGPSLWLLGHVHRTNQWQDAAGIAFYPGSPQALDPGEVGGHGAWCVDFHRAGKPNLRHCPLSTIRYEDLVVNVDGRNDEVAVEKALHEGLERMVQECAKEPGPLELLSCRVHLQGRTALHAHLALHGWDHVDELRRESNGITAVVERIAVNTAPVLDLPNLARGNSPPALLARFLLELERGENLPMIETARERLGTSYQQMRIEGDGEPAGEAAPRQQAPDLEETRQLMRRQGYRLLAQLIEPVS